MAAPRQLLGRRAEELAARWLESQGWVILERNWRSSEGELDLVGRDATGTVVAIEVKCRTTGRAGSGLESVGRDRTARLRRALACWLAAEPRPTAAVRIDLVTVSAAGAGRWRMVRHAGIDGW